VGFRIGEPLGADSPLDGALDIGVGVGEEKCDFPSRMTCSEPTLMAGRKILPRVVMPYIATSSSFVDQVVR
jgi:hypothetical protein